MAARTPPLNACGHWTVSSPFFISSSVIYTCKAIRSFADLKALKVDPFTEYYLLQGISRAVYEQDAINLANIITLASDTLPTVYIPDTYILSYPDVTTIPYRHLVLSISLGAVPDTLVLDDLKTKLKDLTLNSIGIQSTVKEHQACAAVENIDQATHATLESNRLARIATNTTCYAAALVTDAALTSLLDTYTILEDLVVTNNLLPLQLDAAVTVTDLGSFTLS